MVLAHNGDEDSSVFTFVDDARVQLDSDRSANNLAEEAAGVSRVGGSLWCWTFAVCGHGVVAG